MLIRKVTFLHVFLFNSALIKRIQLQSPLCVKHVKDYLESNGAMPYILENAIYKTYGTIKYLHVDLNLSVVNLQLQIGSTSGFYVGLPRSFSNGVDITTLPTNSSDLKIKVESADKTKLAHLVSSGTSQIIWFNLTPNVDVSVLTIDILPRKDNQIALNSQILCKV